MRRVLAGVLTGALIVTAAGSASIAQTPAELDRAKDLYTSARKALDEARYGDAVRDFGAAYEITKDAVMFYWIGNANERAGKCDVALIYYGRYLREGKPSEAFLVTVKERVAACGGATEPTTPTPPEPVGPVGSGSAVAPPVGPGSGSAAPAPVTPPPAKPATTIGGRHQGPWLLVGGSIAMLTIGAVLAYSADAAENDINDLYVGLEGNPPVFDARTKQRYDDLISEGERYQTLSWVSFGLAAGLAGGAAVWFLLSRDTEQAPVIAPTVQKDGAGVSATVRW